MSTSLKNKIAVAPRSGLGPPPQFLQEVAMAIGLWLSSETVDGRKLVPTYGSRAIVHGW